MAHPEVLISAERVSKKFCRSLKRSLYYGVRDISSALLPQGGGPPKIDPVTELPPLRTDEFWAVRDVNFELRRGQCLGLIGRNGAGKSSLLKILNSLIKPDAGRILMRGRVCALIELSAGFNPILTGRENIYNQGALLGLGKSEIDRKLDAIIAFSELEEFVDMPVQRYSSGMRVRLGFAVAAQLEPDVLLLDEVLAVGDTAFRFKCLDAMASMLERSAVIFVSHSMAQIHRVCTHVAVLDKGRVAYYGNDVERGVTTYFSRMPEARHKEFGGGDIALAAAQVSNPRESAGSEDRRTITANYGDSVQFTLTLLDEAAIGVIHISLVVWNIELYPIAFIGKAGALPHRADFEGKKRVRCQIVLPRLELAAGRYSVSLHIANHDRSRRLLRIDNLFTVIMAGNVCGNASYAVTTEFSSTAITHAGS